MKKAFWCVLAAAIGAGGCGSPAGMVPVSGRVLYRGEPAAGAVVYFHRQAEPGSAAGTIPYGIVEDDGTYSLATEGLGNGARTGTYAVLVEWRDTKGDGVAPVKSRSNVKLVKRSRLRSGPDRLKGRYFDAARPLLHADVAAGSTQVPPFDLTD